MITPITGTTIIDNTAPRVPNSTFWLKVKISLIDSPHTEHILILVLTQISQIL